MRKIILILLLIPTVTFAATFATMMDEWIGATRAEFVEVWGYPSQADDVVEIGDDVVIYTVRSSKKRKHHRGTHCAITVTFEDEILTRWKVEGENCPKHYREKEDE